MGSSENASACGNDQDLKRRMTAIPRAKAINVLILCSLACGVLVMSSFAAQASAPELGDGRNFKCGLQLASDILRRGLP